MKTLTTSLETKSVDDVHTRMSIPQAIFFRSRYGAWYLNAPWSDIKALEKSQKPFLFQLNRNTVEDLVLKLLRNELPREHFPASFLECVVDPLADEANYSLDPRVIRQRTR